MSEPSRPEPNDPEVTGVIDGSEPTAVQIVWQNVWVRAVTYLVVTVLILLMLWFYRGSYAFALQVGIVGFLIAYILHPLVAWLGRLRIGRGLAVAITYSLLLLFLAFGSLVISQVVAETGRFVQLIPSALDEVGVWFSALQGWIVQIGEGLPSFLSDRLGVAEESGEIALQVREQFQNFLQQLIRSIQGLLEQELNPLPAFRVHRSPASTHDGARPSQPASRA